MGDFRFLGRGFLGRGPRFFRPRAEVDLAEGRGRLGRGPRCLAEGRGPMPRAEGRGIGPRKSNVAWFVRKRRGPEHPRFQFPFHTGCQLFLYTIATRGVKFGEGNWKVF